MFETKIKDYLSNLKSTIDNLNIEEVNQMATLFLETRSKNKTIYVFGNGGSGSTASHMVCDVLKGCSYTKSERFKIFCLNDNIPTILAYSNDVGYDYIFEEQLKNLMSEEDLIIGISGSGNSENVLRAFDYANKNGGKTLSLTGFNGGKLKMISKYNVHVPINNMQIVEDIHVIIMHILYTLLEKE